MADNVGFTPGTGATISADEIDGVLHQRVKMQFGADGSATDVSNASPLPVDFPSFTDNGLTDEQLRASPVPVSGSFYQATQPVSAAALPLPDGAAEEVTLVSVLSAVQSLATAISAHNEIAVDGHGGLVILAKRRDSDGEAMIGDGDFGYISLDENQRLKVATQPASVDKASGSITANGQNISIKCGRFGNIAVSMVATSLVGHNVSFQCSNNSTNGTDGNWYSVQAVRSNANTVEAASGVLTATPVYMWHVNVGDYQYFRVLATAHTSGTAAYILKPGAYATEPIPAIQVTGTQPVSGTVTATNTTPTALNTSSAATTNPVLVKGSAGTLFNITASNIGAAAAYLKLYNKATAPTVGTDVPVLTLQIPAGGFVSPQFGTLGHRFATGIGIGITGGAADNDTTAIAAAQVKVLTSYV